MIQCYPAIGNDALIAGILMQFCIQGSSHLLQAYTHVQIFLSGICPAVTIGQSSDDAALDGGNKKLSFAYSFVLCLAHWSKEPSCCKRGKKESEDLVLRTCTGFAS
eukprot:scaffold47328_cov17-Tisochrysis_lutea.AAC.2